MNESVNILTKNTIGLGNVENILHNFAATTAPLKTDDETSGYSVGSHIYDIVHFQRYECVDATEDEARWKLDGGEFVVNKSGAEIVKGSYVYQSGAQGGVPTIELANANSEATSSGTWGMVIETIADNGFGYVKRSGAVYTLNTVTFTDGDTLFLSTTDGVYQKSPPPATPNHLVVVGYIDLAHNEAGIVNVRVQNGFELRELHDYLETSITSGEYIKYTGSYYENSDFNTDVSANSDVASNTAHTAGDGSTHSALTLRSDWLQNGFVDKSDVTLTWSDSTPDRTLMIAPAVTSFDYFLDGLRTTINASDTFQIADSEGLHAIYYNDNSGTIAEIVNPTNGQVESLIEDECFICVVYWDDTNSDGRLMSELHGYRMNPATHHYLHDIFGGQWDSGLALGDILSDQTGALDSHAQFSNTAGNIYDEDLKHTLLSTTSTTGLEIWYLDGSDWRWTTNAGFSILTAGTGRLAFNDSGSQTEVNNNSFVLAHVFATNIKTDAGANKAPITIQGQAQYATITLARDGALTEISSLITGSLPIAELVPIATCIYQTSTGYGNSVKGRIRTTEAGDDYIDWRTAQLTPAGSAQDHGALSGLSDDDHSQYGFLAGRSGGQTLIGSTLTAEDLTLKDNAVDNNDITVTEMRSAVKGTIHVNLDGAGSVITAGAKNGTGRAFCAGTITSAYAVSTVDGVETAKSITVEIYKNGSKISASAPVTLSSETESTDSTLSGWSKDFIDTDNFTATVIGTPDAEYVDIVLKYDKTGV